MLKTKYSHLLFPVFIFLGVFGFCVPDVDAETHVTEQIDGNVAWNLAGSPYIIDNYISISASSSLIIKPGVIVKFNNYSDLEMYEGGHIQAIGTPESKIYFTNISDDEIGGDTNGDGGATIPNINDEASLWQGIYVDNGGGAPEVGAEFQNVVFRYAYDGLSVCAITGVSVNDSIFEKNRKGISDCGNSHVILSNTKFKDNKIGIHLNQSNWLPGSVYETSGLSMKNNIDYGVLNETHGPYPVKIQKEKKSSWFANLFKINKALAEDYVYTLDFRNTWWGSPSGPLNSFTNPSGQGNKVSDDVLFDPWVTVDPEGPVCCSSVLFLPGLEASRLYREKSILGLPVEDQLWEPNANSDVEDLYLNADGTSKYTDIYTRDIIEESNAPFWMGSIAPNIYKSFAHMMNTLFDERKIADWKAYAYDWRMSVDDIVNNGTRYKDGTITLTDTLQSLVDTSLNGKVTIVTHSNGGLLAKAFLKKLQEDKDAGRNNLIDSVDVLIMVAAPEVGTASAVPGVLHGYDQRLLGGWLMDEVHARELGRNMLGAFGLLPSKEYLNRVNVPLATFVDSPTPSNITTKLVQTFGSSIDSYQKYKDFLFGTEGRTEPLPGYSNLLISLSQSLFGKAENLHDSIDTWVPPESLRVIEVAGWGLNTVASVEYYPLMWDCSSPTTITCPPFMLDEKPKFTIDGDATVVVPSTHYMSDNGNAEKYWVDLRENNKFPSIQRNHGDIFEVASLDNLIKSVISEEDIVLDDVIKDSQPINDSNILRLSVHSPVTFDAYDVNGNHTGKVCQTGYDFCYKEENVANSSYLEFGEGKYLNLPEDQFSKAKLQGIDVGTFTFDSEKVLPDGTSTISSFINIPVTTQTIAEVISDPTTGVPQLALDVTGDGVNDFTITPNSSFDPVLFLQIMRKTVETFDISKQIKEKLLKRIDDTIKAIQKGKINKAKLKIELFIKALTINPKENDKDRKVREEKNEREERDGHKGKPKLLTPAEIQTLVTLLNQLLDNLN